MGELFIQKDMFDFVRLMQFYWKVSHLFVVFLVDVSCPFFTPQCLPSQRYDVHFFPPRCLYCPRIIKNPVRLSLVSTIFGADNASTVVFNRGTPQNKTCGCWGTRGQTVINVGLNASWVVSGLSFRANKNQWMRRLSVSASSDNVNFLDWGTYTNGNFSDSKIVLFRYPVRATFFRVRVHEYVNHWVNVTSGFPVHISALVSDSEPFSCACASLMTGECCPFSNMEVVNNTCVTCMDPTDIHTVVVEGCGRCKAGTVPLGTTGRCTPLIQLNDVENRFQIEPSFLNRNQWIVHMDVVSRNSALLVFFLTSSDNLPCSPPVSASQCLSSFSDEFKPILWDIDLNYTKSGLNSVVRTSRGVNLRYLQFDRGRFALVLNKDAIRSWATCDLNYCAGNVGVLFINSIETFSSLLMVDVIKYPLIFQLEPPMTNSMVFHFYRNPALISIEIHKIVDKNQFVLWSRPRLNNVTTVQWGDDNVFQVKTDTDGTITVPPPPSEWESMKIFTERGHYVIVPPIPVVVKHSPLNLQFARRSFQVNIAYGLELKSKPEVGDSEQLLTISVVSKEPLRLVRLVSEIGGLVTVYTSSKGFITDPRRVLDLVVACNGMMSINSMVTWLESILGLMDTGIETFANTSCGWVHRREVTKLYWLVPMFREGVKRSELVEMNIDAVFS